MRPRPMTAENPSFLPGPDRGGEASMRPRPMTAENVRSARALLARAELQ